MLPNVALHLVGCWEPSHGAATSYTTYSSSRDDRSSYARRGRMLGCRRKSRIMDVPQSLDRESLPSPGQTENISGTKVFWTDGGPGTVVRLGISLKVPRTGRGVSRPVRPPVQRTGRAQGGCFARAPPTKPLHFTEEIHWEVVGPRRSYTNGWNSIALLRQMSAGVSSSAQPPLLV